MITDLPAYSPNEHQKPHVEYHQHHRDPLKTNKRRDNISVVYAYGRDLNPYQSPFNKTTAYFAMNSDDFDCQAQLVIGINP